MAVNLQGLTDNARKTAIAELNARLADAVALSAAIKQAHWNVKGRNFIAVHELFDQVFKNLQVHVDEMAERVQQLDGVAVGTVEKVAKASSLKEYPTDLTKAELRTDARLRRQGARRHRHDRRGGGCRYRRPSDRRVADGGPRPVVPGKPPGISAQAEVKETGAGAPVFPCVGGYFGIGAVIPST